VSDGSAGGRAAIVWAVGDADGSRASRALAKRITSGRIDRFIYLGDVYETGTREEFERNYDAVFGSLAKKTSPTPGNHEWPLHTEGYEPYWRQAKGRPQPDHYSFELNGWKFLSVNSEGPHQEGSEQERWLRREAGGAGDCRIAFWHRPRHSAGLRHGDQADTQPFWAAVRGHAAIVLNAHEHDLQRFKSIEGVTQFVVGAGGHGQLYPLAPVDERLAFGNDDAVGALRLELRPGLARFAFIASDGRTLDSGSVPCQSA